MMRVVIVLMCVCSLQMPPMTATLQPGCLLPVLLCCATELSSRSTKRKCQYSRGQYNNCHLNRSVEISGLEISWSWEPRDPLNSPVTPKNFCLEPQDVLVSIHITVK